MDQQNVDAFTFNAALFLFYFGRGLEKNCKFFPQKIFFVL